MNAIDDNELDRLAYAYVTGTLDAQEQAWVDNEGMHDDVFQARLSYWQQHISGLDHCVAETAPPAHVWDKISDTIEDKPNASKTTWWLPFAMAASMLIIGALSFWQAPISGTSVNLDNQWLVQLDTGPQQLIIKADNPMDVPAGMVCNLWFKTGKTVVGIAQLPMHGTITLDLDANPQLRTLLNQAGTMMVTMDAADAGLEAMLNQAVINGQWL